LHRAVHDNDLEDPAVAAHDQSACRLDNISLGWELGRH